MVTITSTQSDNSWIGLTPKDKKLSGNSLIMSANGANSFAAGFNTAYPLTDENNSPNKQGENQYESSYTSTNGRISIEAKRPLRNLDGDNSKLPILALD